MGRFSGFHFVIEGILGSLRLKQNFIILVPDSQEQKWVFSCLLVLLSCFNLIFSVVDGLLGVFSGL